MAAEHGQGPLCCPLRTEHRDKQTNKKARSLAPTVIFSLVRISLAWYSQRESEGGMAGEVVVVVVHWREG